jgi:hypothetical protein
MKCEVNCNKELNVPTLFGSASFARGRRDYTFHASSTLKALQSSRKLHLEHIKIWFTHASILFINLCDCVRDYGVTKMQKAVLPQSIS